MASCALLALREFQQHPTACLRVYEADPAAVSAGLGFVRKQPETLRLEGGHRHFDVVDPETDVMESRPPSLDMFGNRRVGPGRLEQFQLTVPHRQKGDIDALLGHFVRTCYGQAQGLVKRQRLRQSRPS